MSLFSGPYFLLGTTFQIPLTDYTRSSSGYQGIQSTPDNMLNFHQLCRQLNESASDSSGVGGSPNILATSSLFCKATVIGGRVGYHGCTEFFYVLLGLD